MSFDPSQPYGTVATSSGRKYYMQNDTIYDTVTFSVVTQMDEVPPNVAYPLPAKAQKLAPALGTFAIWTVPLEKKWKINSVSFILETNTAFRDRQVYVETADPNGNILVTIPCSFPQTPKSTKEYVFGPNLPNATTDLPNAHLGVITTGFPEISLGGHYTITIGAFNFDAGDQFLNCELAIQEYEQ